MQVLLSGAELGCSQEALTVVALASTDPIYFAPRCVLTAAFVAAWCCCEQLSQDLPRALA